MAIAKSTLAKIHIAKQQLGLDDETYRVMLRSVGDVDSARDLTPASAARVLAHLERSGFKPTGGGRRPRVAAGRAAQLAKIEALLADAGRSWDYVNGMVKRICKVDAIEFCNGDALAKLIAALQIDSKRREARR
ncbi:gp16 family protein [Paraburkholderia unamae]|uniref:Phage gp16-like protein n=1 Tax=Paraburkholderia unamae TaxID=219649 RepID=A0ABX5KK00_9BURK|nr:regulatory protein GemA [Paraburkholderia unamae]PVX80033.1 phage gp16-like protein [Paraburkholderia unamae]